MKRIKIALGSDHAGFERKETIRKYLEKKGIDYKDYGCYSEERCDYPDYIHPVAEAVSNKNIDIGIIFCGSGQGANMTANKHQKIRSALCWIPEIAKLSRAHNDANICTIPGRFVTDDLAVEIVDSFLQTEFEGGRHLQRVNKIPLD